MQGSIAPAVASDAPSYELLRARGLFYAALVLFCDAVAGSLGISVLPYFVAEVGGSSTQFGMLISTFATANVLASLWIGAASDVFGRRPLIISSLVGISVGFLGTGLSTSMLPLFGARFTIGFFAGTGSTARAYIADISDTPDERAKQMAQLGGLMMFGYAAGPPIGSILQLVVSAAGLGGGSMGLRTPFLAGALVCTVVAALALARMPTVVQIKMAQKREAAALAASTAAEDKAAAKAEAAPPIDLKTTAAMSLLLINNALGQGGVSLFLVVLPLFIEDTFGWGSGQFSILMTTFILGMAFTQMLVFPKLQKAVGLLRLASLVAVANGLVLLGCSLVTSSERLPLWLALFPLNILSTALASPIVNIKVADLAPKEYLGFAMGLVSTSEQLGRVVAPVGLSAAYQYVSAGFTYRITAYAYFLAACFVVFVMIVLPVDAVAAKKPSALEKLQKAIGKVAERQAALRTLHVERSAGNLEGALMGYSPTKQTSMRTLVALEELKTHEDALEAAAAEGEGQTGGTRSSKTDLL